MNNDFREAVPLFGVPEKPHEHKSCADLTVEVLAKYGITDRKAAFDTLIGNAKAFGLISMSLFVGTMASTGVLFPGERADVKRTMF